MKTGSTAEAAAPNKAMREDVFAEPLRKESFSISTANTARTNVTRPTDPVTAVPARVLIEPRRATSALSSSLMNSAYCSFMSLSYEPILASAAACGRRLKLDPIDGRYLLVGHSAMDHTSSTAPGICRCRLRNATTQRNKWRSLMPFGVPLLASSKKKAVAKQRLP